MAISSSKATTPSPSHRGRYEAMKGTKASTNVSFAKGSITDVRMWITRNTPTRSDRLRCSDWTTNRGQSRRVSRDEVSTPSTTLALSRTRAVYPLARVAYHIGVGPASAASTCRVRSGAAGDRYWCPAVCVLRLLDRRGQPGLRVTGVVGRPGLGRRGGRRAAGEAGGRHQCEHPGEPRRPDCRVDGETAGTSQPEVSAKT